MYYVTEQATDAVAGNSANGHAVDQSRSLATIRRLWAKFFLLTGLSATFLDERDLSAGREMEDAVKTAVREQVLASTIQIKMVDKGRAVAGVKETQIAKGLGTLVERDGQRLIMTHNHWALSEADLERVELRDASGRLLVAMARMSYLSLVRYRDAGTLLLEAPPELDGIRPAYLGASASLTTGESLWIAAHDQQHGGSLTVIEAEVDQAGGAKMPAQLLLRGPKTAIAAGDSGGGVWHDGMLMGNMWAIVESLQETPWAWQGWFSSPVEAKPTGGYIVAEQPLASERAAALFANDGVLISGLLP